MKKIICLLTAAILLLCMFTSCGSGVTITSKTVDGNSHLIVTYSDGTTEDLGLVQGEEKTVTETVTVTEKITITDKKVDENGHLIITYSDGTTEDLGDVTVVPPQYTVRFLDKDGGVLKTQKVYRGTAAEAPEAPSVTDMVFDKWDKDYTNIQGDTDIKAVYRDMESFTVTFVDSEGKTIATQKVITGRSAAAPTAPAKNGYVFTGWDRDFSVITADTTVTAQYRLKYDCTVTFKDYSGLALGTATVEEGATATAPVAPAREGYTFTGWSSTLSGITANKTVTAKYKFNGGTNVMDISYSISGSTLTVTATVKGTVKFASLEGNLAVPAGLTYKSVTNGDDKSLVNYKDGTIYFSTTNPTNITSETVIFKATFTCGTASSYTLDLQITDICDQTFAKVSSSVIGKTVKVK